jgi:hypothetical protein
MLPSTPRPDDQPPHSRLTHWLDRHAHPESRTFRDLDLVRAVTWVLTVAGLLALVVPLHPANITAGRDADNRSVEMSRLIEQRGLANPDPACALLTEGPERGLEVSELRAMRYLLTHRSAAAIAAGGTPAPSARRLCRHSAGGNSDLLVLLPALWHHRQ